MVIESPELSLSSMLFEVPASSAGVAALAVSIFLCVISLLGKTAFDGVADGLGSLGGVGSIPSPPRSAGTPPWRCCEKPWILWKAANTARPLRGT
jgi:hypothetical protein